MAQVAKKLLKLGTGSGELNAADLNANFGSPSNYSPGGTDISSHLQGIDAALNSSTGDISETSFSLSSNQASFANVTGLAFANGTVRSAEVSYSVVIDATADLFEVGSLFLVQRGSDWSLARDFNGDDSLLEFDVTAAGQVQYKSSNYAGFSSGTIKFRAITTGV
jgi:hypothetical protein